ncbi:MAG: hypothetical protein IKK70_06655 [Clostridia bacterium]|nr:hypothetical protein [Clostridia bacterium]
MVKLPLKELFGERLKKEGFVAKNKGVEWHRIGKNGFLFSLYFDDDDIRFRVQPLCCRLLYSLKKNRGSYFHDLCYCEVARNYYPFANNKLLLKKPSSTTVYLHGQDLVDYYSYALDMIILPYFNSINSLSDIVCIRDWSIKAASAYLRADADAYYGISMVFRGITFIKYQEGSDEEHDFWRSIRKSVETKDMSCVGKCLQRIESENIQYLKSNFKALFKNVEVEPMITDEYIAESTLKEIRTAEDYQLSIPDTVKKVEGVEYIPFPNDSPVEIDPSVNTKEIAQKLINDHFSKLLYEKGFETLDEGISWYRWFNDELYANIRFELLKDASMLIMYFVGKPYAENMKGFIASIGAKGEFLKLIGAPITYENFPNSLGSGEAVLNWQISRLACQLHYVVFPKIEAKVGRPL